jgi:hypothetical protein
MTCELTSATQLRDKNVSNISLRCQRVTYESRHTSAVSPSLLQHRLFSEVALTCSKDG